MYDVGQILYTVLTDKQIVVPVKVVEQVVVKTLEGEKVDYKLQLPNKKNQKVSIDKFINLYEDIISVEEYLTSNPQAIQKSFYCYIVSCMNDESIRGYMDGFRNLLVQLYIDMETKELPIEIKDDDVTMDFRKQEIEKQANHLSNQIVEELLKYLENEKRENINNISYEKTGNKLISIIKEYNDSISLKPKLKKKSKNIDKYDLEKKLDFRFEDENFLIIDKGNSPDNKSFIWIKNHNLIGYGFFNLNHQINNSELLKKLVVSVKYPEKIISVIKYFYKKKKFNSIVKIE